VYKAFIQPSSQPRFEPSAPQSILSFSQYNMSSVIAPPRGHGLEISPFSKRYVNGSQQDSSRFSTYKRPGEDGGIIDIRRGAIEHSVLEDMMSKLQPGTGKEKQMPTLLLYDELGLKLFEDITYLDEYYLTNAEIDVLQRNAADIASRLRPDSMIVELGSGYGLASSSRDSPHVRIDRLDSLTNNSTVTSAKSTSFSRHWSVPRKKSTTTPSTYPFQSSNGHCLRSLQGLSTTFDAVDFMGPTTMVLPG
jgi:hypothetical protein